MHLYCPRCSLVFSGNYCPNCGGKRFREPEDEDLCFLVEKGQIWCDMLADVLKQHGIPCIAKGRLGAGLAMQVGSFLETQRVYVAYADLKEAAEIVEELFGSEQEESDFNV